MTTLDKTSPAYQRKLVKEIKKELNSGFVVFAATKHEHDLHVKSVLFAKGIDCIVVTLSDGRQITGRPHDRVAEFDFLRFHDATWQTITASPAPIQETLVADDAASEKQTSPASFTAGPWKFHRPHPDPITSAMYGEITGIAHGVYVEHSTTPIACIFCCEAGGIQEMNTRLLTASANSYMANAVDPIEAAEQDLLSEALTALRGMVEHHTPGHWISLTHEKHHHLLDAMAVLAKAK